MAKNTEKVTLGNGDLYLNNIDVGHLKGDVEFVYEMEKVGFKPANMTTDAKLFLVRENCTLKASLAELKVANLKLAMGINTTIQESSSFPAYDPSSYAPAAGASYDVLTFGGEKTIVELPLRFVHQRPDDKKIIIVLYKAVSEQGLTLPFHEEDVNIHDITFKGLCVSDRTEGDQIGFIAEQVTAVS